MAGGPAKRAYELSSSIKTPDWRKRVANGSLWSLKTVTIKYGRSN
jgi:hypothetical protein